MTDDQLVKWILDQAVRDENGCLVLPSVATNQKGYSILAIRRKSRLVYHWLYEQEYGKVQKGKELAHECMNSSCIDTEHLRETSRSENSDDEPRNGIVSLRKFFTWEDVERIRTRYFNSDIPYKKIAEMEGGCWRGVVDILTGRSYRNAPGPISKKRKPERKGHIKRRKLSCV